MSYCNCGCARELDRLQDQIERRQLSRCSGVAASKRGNQTSGTEILRPSSRRTSSDLSDTSTVTARALSFGPALCAEVVMLGGSSGR
jgi:hypothetical protein